jgi:hypothetical protein
MLLLFSGRITRRKKIGYLGAAFLVVGVILVSFGTVPGINLAPWAYAFLLTGVSFAVLFGSPTRSLVFTNNRILNALLTALVIPIVLIVVGILIIEIVGLNLDGFIDCLTIAAPVSVVLTFFGAISLKGASCRSGRGHQPDL